MQTTPDRIGENQKIIGVIGVAPWSTLEFLGVLYKQFSADKDWHYPRILCDVNTKIPSRGRHFELGEEDFTPYILMNIEKLKEYGAEIIVVTCNTAHIYFDRWSKVDGVEILHIVDECSRALKKLPVPITNQSRHTTAVFSGYSLWKTGLYQEKIKHNDIDVFELSDQEARLINLVIMDIKKNGYMLDIHLIDQLEKLLQKLKNSGVCSVILGCTELTAIEDIAAKYVNNIIDSNLELARAIIRCSNNRI